MIRQILTIVPLAKVNAAHVVGAKNSGALRRLTRADRRPRVFGVYNRAKNISSIALRADSRAMQAAIIVFAIVPWILS